MKLHACLIGLLLLSACNNGGGNDMSDRYNMRRDNFAGATGNNKTQAEDQTITAMVANVNNDAQRADYVAKHGNTKYSVDAEFNNMELMLLDFTKEHALNCAQLSTQCNDWLVRALNMAGFSDTDWADDRLDKWLDENWDTVTAQAKSVQQEYQSWAQTIADVNFTARPTDGVASDTTMNFKLDKGRITSVTLGAEKFARIGGSNQFGGKMRQLVVEHADKLGLSNELIEKWTNGNYTEDQIYQQIANHINTLVAAGKITNRGGENYKSIFKEYSGSNKTADMSYLDVSLMGEKYGLSYADFGMATWHGAAASGRSDETVFGGYDKMVTTPQSGMKFTGGAVGVVTSNGEQLAVSGNADFTFDPSASAQGNLHASFDNWYDVNTDGTEFKFQDTGNVTDDKWRFDGDAGNGEQFTGTGTGGMRSDFYGDGTAQEVVGETWYEDTNGGTFQGAFGGKAIK